MNANKRERTLRDIARFARDIVNVPQHIRLLPSFLSDYTKRQLL